MIRWLLDRLRALIGGGVRRVRDRPGLTAEMERWEKATNNLLAMKEHGLSPAQVREHKKRMEGLAQAAEQLPPEVSAGIFILVNKIALHAGESALLLAVNWSESKVRVLRGEPGARAFLSQTAHETMLGLAQSDYRWALDFLRKHDQLDPDLAIIILAHEDESYMQPDRPEQIASERNELLEPAPP